MTNTLALDPTHTITQLRGDIHLAQCPIICSAAQPSLDNKFIQEDRAGRREDGIRKTIHYTGGTLPVFVFVTSEII